MKVGDKVYITADDARDHGSAGVQTVTKVGNRYFEVENTPWEKFIIDTEKGEHPLGYDTNCGVRAKDTFSPKLKWWLSKEAWEKNQKVQACKNYIIKNLHLMNDDEIIDFAKLLTEREKDYVVRSK